MILTLVILTLVVSWQENIQETKRYTKRHYQVDKDLFKSFETEYAIKVNVVYEC